MSDNGSPNSDSPTAKDAVHGQKLDVLLVSMPFGPQILQPSLALSLLKAHLEPLGIPTKVRYFTLDFAAKIGVAAYGGIAYTEPTTRGFLGDWLFNEALFDDVEHDVAGYVENILQGRAEGFQETKDNLRAISDEVIAQLLDIRRLAKPFVEECLKEVLSCRPRIVGFTSTFQQQVGALALARRIKQEAPETFIVFGGANGEGPMGAEVLRQFTFVDAVVSGEADLIFPGLVQRVLAGQAYEDLQGVNTRKTSGFSRLMGARFSSAPMVHDMDALPYPDFSDFFAQYDRTELGLDKTTRRPRLMFETSRGCWWGAKSHCTFCGLNGGTMAFRAKSGPRALQELLYLHERHPGSAVSVTDNILDMKYFKSFLPELAARGINLELFYEVKANLRKDQVKLMKRAGITDIQPGIENFSDQVLDLMRKGVRGLQNIQLLKWCKEYGVKPHWNMLWGFPGESPEEYARMAAMFPWLHHLPPAGGGGLIRLDRFSPNYDRADEFGFVDVSPSPGYQYVYPKFDREVLSHLAYFFTYRYRDPRDIRGYTEAVREGLKVWRDAYETSDLFIVDKGNSLLIWDLRPHRVEPLTVLDGVLREIYVACDAICQTSRLAEIIQKQTGRSSSAEEIESLLQPLLDRGLLLRDGQSWLALAIPLGEYSPGPKILKRFQETTQELGPISLSKVKVQVPPHLEPLPAAAGA